MSFIKWVQERLNYHGALLDEDGDFGALTRDELMEFQERSGIYTSGITDSETIDALKRDRKDGIENSPSSITSVSFTPVWLAEMTRRMGLHEVRDNRKLSQWLRIGKYLGNPKDLPWCGDAVETCFAKTVPDEPLPSNPFWAQGWRNFGVRLDEPEVGAVGVIRWSKRAGHVGLVINWNSTKICLRGGNQANALNDRWFPRKKFIAYRWPGSVAFEHYARIRANAGSANLKSTR